MKRLIKERFRSHCKLSGMNYGRVLFEIHNINYSRIDK